MATSVSEDITRIWKTRSDLVIADEAVTSLAEALQDSSATLEASVVVGGAQATGLGARLGYDDVQECGNDMRRILDLLKQFPTPQPPPGDPWPIVSITTDGDRFTVLLALGVLPAEAFDAINPLRQVGRFVRV